MYICHDGQKVIAFHEKKSVVETYVNNIYRFHNFKLDISKVSKDTKRTMNKNYELYLVRYGETYVQSGYTPYLQLQSEQYIEDEKYARDVLYRLLESRLKGKKYKKIKAAVKILENMILEDESYTPTLKELQGLKMDYDPYLYNMGVYY